MIFLLIEKLIIKLIVFKRYIIEKKLLQLVY